LTARVRRGCGVSSPFWSSLDGALALESGAESISVTARDGPCMNLRSQTIGRNA
jgi:hypothetical protein